MYAHAEKCHSNVKKVTQLKFFLFKKIFFVKIIVTYLKKKGKLNNRDFKAIELIYFSVYIYMLVCIYSSQILEKNHYYVLETYVFFNKECNNFY